MAKLDRNARSRPLGWLIGGLLALIGAVLLVGGVKLLLLGGSFYYVLAGVACLASGFLIIRGSGKGVALYAAFLIFTVLWSLYEVRLQFWQLLPRLAGPTVFALLMALPFVYRRLVRGADRAGRFAAPVATALSVLVLLGGWVASRPSLPAHQLAGNGTPSSIAAGEADMWNAYGRTVHGTRYSPAAQITPANVGGLKLAWSYETGETARKMPEVTQLFSFMATPLMVEEKLFFCSPRGVVIALDPDTGAQIWRFDPQAVLGDAQMLNCRGVSYHADPAATGICASRILSTTIDGRLLAVDAGTGAPCTDFGDNGVVSLKTGMGEMTPAATYTSSPPAIIGDTAVLGAYIRDNFTTGEPSGVVRAFDVKTGELLWAWDAGRPVGAGPLAEGETYSRGSPNAWTVFSADPALGLVYVPMGNATPDHVAMHRTPGDERYSSAVVALDAATGEVRWHFQTVRRDIWDYDLPAQPVLFNLPVDGRDVPALAVPTKLGDIYILDRATGRPLTEVAERAAPQGDLPGETYSPTQPRSVGFPSLAPADLRERDMWGATPLDQMWCRITYRSYDYQGAFTPPSTRGAIQYPGIFGILNWGSVSIDEGRRLMIVNASAIPQIVRLYPRTGTAGDDVATGDAHTAGYLPQTGTPYGVSLLPMLSPLGIPCHSPPWGHLTAIDLNTREILWQRPLGTTRDSAPLGIAVPGVFNIGGSVTTRTGLSFIAATLDNYLRAFDVSSGRELWRGRLPAGGQASPITYTSAKTGRQYVVIAAGGHGFLGTTPGDYVQAFALDGEAAEAPPAGG